MGTAKAIFSATALATIAGAVIFAVPATAQQSPQKAITAADIDSTSIGGVVTSRIGPEAGVWVVAETNELGTKFAKMVVTDDFGRYVIPDLPQAHYKLWVRGYGLVDSPKSDGVPGQVADLKAVIAPNLAAAAQYYPPIYWYSMLKIPDASQFPGTGPDGNGLPTAAKTQGQWVNMVNTNGCVGCHQIGDYATRTIPSALGHFDSSIEAWARRIQSGPAGVSMVRTTASMMTPAGGELAALADWTDRIKAGELPSQSPPRPTGLERNLVVTVRDWSDPKHYLHDLISSDK
ncbi:MAG TPA: carboxypeptidase-like regulatory domain-containing protein, partial [Beijerinckiaceae bacterium]|nr:carboxypeptidase-like regulatory domain-containing protein [Beijerinckiaceae bacterium]